MVAVYSKSGKTKDSVELPEVFKTPVRWDLIRKAVIALHSQRRKPYGTDPLAGLRTSADYFGRRRGSFRMTINRGMSRLPRIKSGGGGLGDVRRVPQAVGGRRAHPPKAVDKSKQMNTREYSKAVESAIAASADREIVSARGHKIEGVDELPIVFDDSLEEVRKTRDLVSALQKAGLGEELARGRIKKSPAKKSRRRSVKRKNPKSVLIVACEDRGLLSAAGSIPGVDAVLVADIDAELLAPGGKGGRLTVWTKSALKKLEDGSA